MHLPRLSKFIMVAFALSAMVAQAKNSTSAPQLPDVSAISQIELTLITGDIRIPRPMREEDLSKWGCTYTSSPNSEEIQAAISVLRSNLRTSEQKENSFQLRNMVILKLKTGKEAKILLGASYDLDDAVFGTFIDEPGKAPIDIVTSGRLLQELEIWSRNILNRKSDSDACSLRYGAIQK